MAQPSISWLSGLATCSWKKQRLWKGPKKEWQGKFGCIPWGQWPPYIVRFQLIPAKKGKTWWNSKNTVHVLMPVHPKRQAGRPPTHPIPSPAKRPLNRIAGGADAGTHGIRLSSTGLGGDLLCIKATASSFENRKGQIYIETIQQLCWTQTFSEIEVWSHMSSSWKSLLPTLKFCFVP